MPVYSRPDVYAVEENRQDGPVKGAAVGFGALLGITEKGPVGGAPVRTRSFPAWQRIFGGYQAVGVSNSAYEAKSFFENGGHELLTLRMCNYTDLDDPSTFSGGVASRTVATGGVAATAASKTSAVGPFRLDPGDSFTMEIDDGGDEAPAFNATEAEVTDTTTYPVADQSGLTDIFIVNGVSKTVTYPAGTTANTDVEDAINDQIKGIKATVTGGQVKVRTDQQGSGATLTVGSGTAATTWGTPTAGTGNVADVDAITAVEAAAIVAAVSTSTVVANANGSFSITSPTTGPLSEVDFKSGVLAKFGFSVETINGTAAGATYNTLKLEAGYHGQLSPGVAGNNLSSKIILNPKKTTNGAGNDIASDATAADTEIQVSSIRGLVVKSLIKIWDGSNTEYHQVKDVRSVVSGGVVSFYVDLESALANSFTAAASQLQSLEFDVEIYENSALVESKFKQMSTLDTADNYFVTLMNDENTGSEYAVATDLNPSPPGIGADLPAADSAAVAFTGGTSETTGISDADWIGTATGKTGMYGLDVVRDFLSFCTPGNNSAAVAHAATDYARSRIWFEYIGYVANGMSAADAVSYRQDVLGVNNSHGCLYAGGIEVFDPAGSGSNPKREISGLGAMMGLRAKVDSLPVPNGGPWNAPAGEGDYGTIIGALGTVTDYSDTEMGQLNDAHVNVIKKFGNTSPVLVWGARTLDASTAQRFRYINTRRFFSYVEKSVVDSTRWSIFRNNDFRLWGKLKDRVVNWLSDLMLQGAFPTSEKDLAFFVKVGIDDGVMTASDKDNGLIKGKIGLAPQKAGEFLEWSFSQFESGYDVEDV